MRVPLLLDFDDALAILYAAANGANIRADTATHGNVPVATGARNTLTFAAAGSAASGPPWRRPSTASAHPTHHAASVLDLVEHLMTDASVQTVLGPVQLSDLGPTLMHEHLFNNLGEAVHRGVAPFVCEVADRPVSAKIAWALREDPYSNPDNCRLDDEDATCEELALFAGAGGRTVVDNTTGIGRDPAALRRVAARTGLNIVMGGGWCLAHGHDDTWAGRDPARAADELVDELTHGAALEDGTRVRPGIIGEIGVGPQFTASERMTLIASAIAQTRTGVPLLIHLPGWQRRAHEVLDIVLELGVDPRAIVLCHMDPSGGDPGYQRSVAARGVWLEFDMIGMPYNFPGEGQSPSVHETAAAVAGLLADGFTGQVLLSHDVFLKGMWTRHGGNGYGFVPTAFLPRLVGLGVDPAVAARLLTTNPAAVFAAAAATTEQTTTKATTTLPEGLRP